MFRFLHTSDWQLGHRPRPVPAAGAAAAREERFRTVERVARLAHERQVHAVLVAGDALDDNQVGPAVLARARQALTAFAPIPVVLVPGNRDPAEPGAALGRLGEGLAHVHVALTPAPVELTGGVVLPCPVPRRHDPADPLAALPERPADDPRVRVAVAHAGLRDLPAQDAVSRADLPAALARGVDWIALGDRHELHRVHPRAAYPGTPEPTAFPPPHAEPGAPAAGHVLLVEIDGPGAEPRVEALHVAGCGWHAHQVALASLDDVLRLDALLARLDRRSLARVRLEGALGLEARSRLDAVLARHRERLVALEVDDQALATRVEPADRASLEVPPFVLEALDALAEGGTPDHLHAARLLHALAREVPR